MLIKKQRKSRVKKKKEFKHDHHGSWGKKKKLGMKYSSITQNLRYYEKKSQY